MNIIVQNAHGFHYLDNQVILARYLILFVILDFWCPKYEADFLLNGLFLHRSLNLDDFLRIQPKLNDNLLELLKNQLS